MSTRASTTDLLPLFNMLRGAASRPDRSVDPLREHVRRIKAVSDGLATASSAPDAAQSNRPKQPPSPRPTASTMLDLPQELIDRIVDHLYDDIPALIALSLTSKSWLSSSRYHTFSEVSLRPWTAQAFISLLAAPHENITPYVATLRLTAGRFLSQKNWMTDGLAQLKALQRVRMLEIKSASWSSLGPQAQEALNTHFPLVTHLLLTFVRFQCVCQFADLIRAHPNLESLQLDVVKTWADVSLVKSCDPPRFRALYLGACEKERFLSWVLSSDQAYQSLRSLVLEQIRDEELPSVGRLLRAVGPSLTRLSVCLPFPGSGVDYERMEALFFKTFNLSANVALRTVEFNANAAMEIEECKYDTWLRYITTMLASITSHEVEEINFSSVFVGREGLCAVGWDVVDELLAKPLFARVRCVKFWMGRLGGDRAMLLRASLPRCNARGIIVID